MTPASYLELMKLFVYVLKVQQNMFPLKMKKYTKRFITLAEIKVEILKLQWKIVEFKPVLYESSKYGLILVYVLVVRFKVTQLTEAVVSEEADEAWMWRDEVYKLKIKFQRYLNAALPILIAAQDDVGFMDNSALNWLKSYANPPALVNWVLYAIALLFRFQET